MSSVAIHFASGAAIFSGSACLGAGLLIVNCARRRFLPAAGRLLVLAGLFLIVMSATPLPVWLWCVWGASLVLWMASRRNVAGILRIPRPLQDPKREGDVLNRSDADATRERHAER